MVCRRSSVHALATHPELLTARLTLRRFELEDAPFVIELLNQPSFIRNIGDRGVRSIEDAHRYLREGPMAMYANLGYGLWHVARNSDGTPVGMCGLLKRDYLPDPDVGYAFLPEYWGTGYAFEAAEATLRHGADKFGLQRILATVITGNASSIRLLEKLGLQFERLLDRKPGEPEVRLYGRTL